jgi:hypothetical protein
LRPGRTPAVHCSTLRSDQKHGFASIKWTVELNPHCAFLEFSRADITNVIMPGLAIVKPLNVIEHIRWCLISGPVLTTPDTLTFQAGKEALNDGIVTTTAGTTQTAADAMLLK